MIDQANSIFVNQSETAVATIGSNYLQNFLSGGSVGKGIGVLTQKRFYFKGQNFSGTGKDMKNTTEEGVVSVEDITFTMFSHIRNIGALAWGIFLAVVGTLVMCMAASGAPYFLGFIAIGMWVASLPFFVSYFSSRKSLFVISFPGGSFGFDIRYYPISDIRDFQRQFHLMKDHLKENG